VGAASGLPFAPHYKNLLLCRGRIECLYEYLGIQKSLFKPNNHVTKLILIVVVGSGLVCDEGGAACRLGRIFGIK
jgi:hypothetical protein